MNPTAPDFIASSQRRSEGVASLSHTDGTIATATNELNRLLLADNATQAVWTSVTAKIAAQSVYDLLTIAAFDQHGPLSWSAANMETRDVMKELIRSAAACQTLNDRLKTMVQEFSTYLPNASPQTTKTVSFNHRRTLQELAGSNASVFEDAWILLKQSDSLSPPDLQDHFGAIQAVNGLVAFFDHIKQIRRSLSTYLSHWT